MASSGSGVKGARSSDRRTFEDSGQPKGGEVRMEPEKIYGRNQMDERLAQLLALEVKSRVGMCDVGRDISDFLVRLDRIWAGFNSLGCPTTDGRRVPHLFSVSRHMGIQLRSALN